ncbi:MAG TPA: glycosyltransferase family 2 protein [Thermoanaerobaculia bacterium]|nr:glycosyltransferase family 2 protein [Thermoanaerobaculia bacterium]
MSDAGAIILDLDGGAALEETLDSIAAQTRRFRRVLVWDNGSRVPAKERIGERYPWVHIRRSESNLGFTGGINAAMRLIDSDLVAWINNDVRLEPRWLEAMIEVLGDRGVAAAQSINMGERGRIDGAGIKVGGGVFRQVGHGEPLPFDLPAEPWGVSATAALYRARALRDVSPGGAFLDPRFFLYYEDVELCARLRAAGWHFSVVAEPLAFHRGSLSAKKEVLADFFRVRNRYWVPRLHPGVGRRTALLGEDSARIAKAIVRADLRGARQILSAVVAGLRGPE